MKKTSMFLSMLAVAFLLAQGAAFAKSISGKVASVDPVTQSLTVSAVEADKAAEDVNLKVGADTKYSGIAAFDELKAGADVQVEAEQDSATGDWMATSVTVGGAESAPAEAAAPAPAAN